MSSSKQPDPAETYVLEETAITKVSSLEELAELALGEGKKDSQDGGSAGGSKDRPTGTREPARGRP